MRIYGRSELVVAQSALQNCSPVNEAWKKPEIKSNEWKAIKECSGVEMRPAHEGAGSLLQSSTPAWNRWSRATWPVGPTWLNGVSQAQSIF